MNRNDFIPKNSSWICFTFFDFLWFVSSARPAKEASKNTRQSSCRSQNDWWNDWWNDWFQNHYWFSVMEWLVGGALINFSRAKRANGLSTPHLSEYKLSTSEKNQATTRSQVLDGTWAILQCLVFVGGDWNMTDIFSIYWEFHHPKWRTYIFQSGWNHQPDYIMVIYGD